jgi:transcriptional regulator with XRE-family HTH domain
VTVLGDAVKYRREHEKIGVREAGQLAGVSPATLNRVERGEDPDIKTFSRLCRWLGLSPTMFLDENGLR